MRISHVDRNGKPWTFDVDCTPVQGQLFQRLLTFVRCIGNREELTLTYLEDWAGNTAFRDEMEHVVLSALQQWTGTATHEPVTPTPTTTATEPPPTPSGNDDDDDGTPHYYWENF